MKKTQITKLFLCLLSANLLLNACYKEIVVPDEPGGVVPGTGLADWTNETHTDNVSPNYQEVLPQDKVNKIEVVISPENWAIMLDDLTKEFGPFGSGKSSGANPVTDKDLLQETSSDFTPVFVPASVIFNGIEWYYVGVRFKGNNNLADAWLDGNMKLELRFDFDEFEDDYPEIKNQRFYGFQKLNFANNFEDVSFLREKLAADVFRTAGLKAPQTAFYRVFIDNGTENQYFGLYTAVEIVEVSMLENQFGSSSGNCYEADGATFEAGSFDMFEFEKKTNEDQADYSDVQSVINLLNADTRLTDEAQWRSDFESVFDVDIFMNWLAVNTVMHNPDAYGNKAHNFYLYNNPATQKLVWIPVDNNETFFIGKKTPLSFSMDEVSAEWPLIRYLIDMPEYKALYLAYLQQTIDGAFMPSAVKEQMQFYFQLIQPYVNGAEGEQSGFSFQQTTADFPNAYQSLQSLVDERYVAATNYLSTQ